MVNPSYIQKYEVNNLRTVLQLFFAGWRIVFKIQLNSSNPPQVIIFQAEIQMAWSFLWPGLWARHLAKQSLWAVLNWLLMTEKVHFGPLQKSNWVWSLGI